MLHEAETELRFRDAHAISLVIKQLKEDVIKVRFAAPGSAGMQATCASIAHRRRWRAWDECSGDAMCCTRAI